MIAISPVLQIYCTIAWNPHCNFVAIAILTFIYTIAFSIFWSICLWAICSRHLTLLISCASVLCWLRNFARSSRIFSSCPRSCWWSPVHHFHIFWSFSQFIFYPNLFFWSQFTIAWQCHSFFALLGWLFPSHLSLAIAASIQGVGAFAITTSNVEIVCYAQFVIKIKLIGMIVDFLLVLLFMRFFIIVCRLLIFGIVLCYFRSIFELIIIFHLGYSIIFILSAFLK